jgi:hypothetical protein
VPVAPSAFVTVLGWLMIGGSLLGILSSLAPLAASSVMPAMLGDLPPEMQLPFSPLAVIRWLALASLLSAGYTLYAAAALIGRRNWARRFFILMFALGLACNLLLLVSMGLMSWAGGLAWLDGAMVPAGVGVVFGMLANLLLGWTVLATLLLWWLIHRLRSPSIRAEFAPPER